MLNAKNGTLSVNRAEMPYIRFGSGIKRLVLLPGVGDGLTTVKGLALPFALLYRWLGRDFTVYMFSRRVPLAEHTTTRDMAADVARAMDCLGIEKAAVVGVSQGGMIAQWLAIDCPERVSSLVLTVTAARPNPCLRESVTLWMEQARRGDYQGIMLDYAARSYSPKRVKQARLTYGLLGNLGRPKSFERFLIQAEACLTHDAFSELGRIACPTLVLGGTDDRVLSGEASRELASSIPGAELYLFKGLSHGLHEEAPDFLDRVIAFCR